MKLKADADAKQKAIEDAMSDDQRRRAAITRDLCEKTGLAAEIVDNGYLFFGVSRRLDESKSALRQNG